MAKRSRAAARPGQMRPTRRPQRPATGVGATDASRSDAASAPEEVFVADDAPEFPADRGARGRERARPVEPPVAARSRGTQPSGLLAARAAQEYAYVARDVRHIGVVGGGLFVVLLVLYFLIEVLHLVKL